MNEIIVAEDRPHAERAIQASVADHGAKWPKAVAKVTAQGRWRAVNAPHLVALVRAGARFAKGKLVKRPAEPAREVPA